MLELNNIVHNSRLEYYSEPVLIGTTLGPGSSGLNKRTVLLLIFSHGTL